MLCSYLTSVNTPSKYDQFPDKPQAVFECSFFWLKRLWGGVNERKSQQWGFLNQTFRVSILMFEIRRELYLQFSEIPSRTVFAFTGPNLGDHDGLIAPFTVESKGSLSYFLRSTAFAFCLKLGHPIVANGYRNSMRITHTNASA